MPAHTLAIGTRLREYEVKGLIGEGTCSIVYLAWDHALQRKVAVKEYMPAAMVGRIQGSTNVVVAADRHLEAVRAGLKGFVNEARLLARFDHPSLVKVYRFWEENGTAYMVMPYYEGPTLKAALAELGHVPSESRAAHLAEADPERRDAAARRRASGTRTSAPTRSCSRRSVRSCSASPRPRTRSRR